MKLLKIDGNCGHFLGASNEYIPIDKITKEDLLRLAGQALENSDSTLDPFDSELIKNQAHQVIYKSVSQKLSELQNRRTEFIDESARLFLDEYERYAAK